MDRRALPGMSPASSQSSLTGTPGTTSPAPSSPRGSVSGRTMGEGRGQGIQMQIQSLAHEQERVQKKTFTNWMNTYLCQKTPPLKVANLFEEIKDGVVLLSLLEVLSGERLPMEKGPRLKRPHHLSNISTALKFLEQKKIKLVNINSTDIADGKPAICLGLIWTIILYFQIEETISQVPNVPDGDGPSAKKKPALPKQSLLAWAESVLAKKYGVHVKDFGKSWRDGVAFNAMIHNIRPDLVDLENARLQTARINLEHAFSTAENHLGIPRLLDPEDVDVEKPDEKSIMTYVAQFLKAYPDAGDPNFRGVPSTTMETADQEMQAYTSLMNWLNIDAPDILQNIDEPIEDRQAEFMEYLGFKTELDRREPVYKKIGERIATGKALKVKPAEWEKLDTRWKEVVAQGRKWLLKLDASLPGRLGQFGAWLMQAEMMLEKEVEMLENPEEMAQQLVLALQEHRDFFKDLEPNRVFFAQVKKSGRYEGQFLHAPHVDLLAKRMDAVCRLAPVRQRRLEYRELRFRLLSYLVAAEQKLKTWSVKYGHQDSVEAMLADYHNFVVRGQLFENYDKTYADIKKKETAYKQDGADPAEVQAMDRYLEDVTARWKKVSVEIRSVESMLKETIENWHRFSACVDVLTVWITEGESVMKKSPEEKQEFFQEIGSFEEKHKLLNEAGNFLIEMTQEPIATEIKQTLLMLNRRFSEMVEGYQHFQLHEVIGRKRSEYAEGVEAIKEWLSGAQGETDRQVPCIFAELKKYLEQLDEMNNQIGQVENDFKTTTKTAQSLVKDSTQEVVNSMLQTLNVQKEVIVKLRKQIPERIKYVKAILSHVESLEVGVAELEEWLERGETLLKSYKLDSTGEQTDARLEAHKAFFSEFTYRKSILESKNKVHQKVSATKDKLPNVDMRPADEMMRKINEKFQNVTTDAREWEKKLEAMTKLWRTLHQKQTQLDSWLDNAAAVLEEREDNVESLIRKHKMFFDRADQRLLQDYLNVGAEILLALDDRDKIALQSCMTDIQNRWKEVQRLAPLRLLKLEFAVPENKFEGHMETAEKALKQQQDQFARGENVKEALQKHRQMFHQGPFMGNCEKCLEEMQDLSQQLLKLSKEDRSLQRRHKDHEDEFEKLRKMIDRIHLQLKQLPERWREYNSRVGELTGWMAGMETLLNDLKRQDLTSEEYKEKLAKFQKELANKDKFAKESKWLADNLDELLKDAPDADSAKERERLKALLARFSGLSPGIEETSGKSGVLAKSFEYRDSVDKRRSWLDEAQKLVLEQPSIDSLEDARVYLQEHESIMVKLETERPSIQADLEMGKRLKQDKGTPDFVLQSMEDLDRKWKDTNELAQAKHNKLKQVVQDWEKYEGEKGQLLQYLKKAEAELEKPPAVTGRELAEKDLQSKQELKSTLDKLKGSLGEVQRLNKMLAEGASRERQGPLKGEASDIDKRLESVSKRLNAKLADLEATIAKWNEYYKRLNNFCDWLNEKEAKLNEVYENKTETPENQLKKAETISSEVYENHISLENLEKDAKGLSQNFRSRETAALKSKLTTVRRQWESLCSRAKDRSTALSGNVQHWQRYQNLQEQLMPWIVKAEKYCATELPKCASLEEARDLHDLHQAFLQECEENLPVFEKMSTEAGYLMEQPDMARQLESIQKRWSNIFTSSEERSHQIGKMYGAWTAYCNELDNFQETMDKFHSRLAAEPNISSTDVQVLEHELALAKALQEEIRSHQPQLNALQRQFGQVQPHASPEGLTVLKAKQEGIKSAWNEVNETVAERQKVLANAVQHRRDFYGRLGEVEKWVKKMQRKLDSGSEIYSDEVQETINKLRALKKECSQEEPEFQALQQEFKELMAGCSDDEAAILSDRFDKLLSGYTRMEDLLKNREEVCGQWNAYSQDHKDAQLKLKSLQAQLQAPDVKEEEVALINKEVEALRQSMKDWNKQSRALDDLMGDAQMVIKDRATQRTLHFGTELQNLDGLCDGVASSARMKEEHLGELSQLGEEFTSRKDALLARLEAVEDGINSAQVSASTLQGVKDLIAHIEDIRDDMYSNNPEYEQLRELGRQIMQSDSSQVGAVQGQLASVNTAWEKVQALLGEKHQYLAGVLAQWQQYNDSKQAVARVLDDVEPNARQSMAFTSPAEVKKALDQHKNAEFDLHANQTQLDHMNNKGLQLLQELRKVPNFDMQTLEQDLDKVNHRWETANSTIEEHRENLEAQLNCWDQVQTGREEVAAWVSAMVQKLDDSIHNFDDAVTVESRLLKFKEECPYFAEVFKEVEQKTKDLQELNSGKEIPVLHQAQSEIKEQFAKSSKLANQLEAIMSNFSDEQKDLQAAIAEETDFINHIKDELAKCDDITGTDEEVLERLQRAKGLQEQLAAHQKKILAIKDKTMALQAKYPSAETASLNKDGNALVHKLETYMSRSQRLQDAMAMALEQNCQTAQQLQQRWLTTAKEKVSWCGDIAGDRYSVEAKLTTVKEMQDALAEGQQLKEASLAKLTTLKQILPRSRQAELESQRQTIERDWHTLISQVKQTEEKLGDSLEQWHAHDERYENLNQWLKDMEARVRMEAVPKPDLATKQEQLQLFHGLGADIQGHRPQFENLHDSAQQISRSTGDNRTVSYAGQLVNRYQTLSTSAREQVEQCKKNIEDHDGYVNKHQQFTEWLTSAMQQLEQCSDMAVDEESLKMKLTIAQNLLTSKDQGLAFFNSVLEAGERLYPTTSNEGRESIRRELRALRDSWENFNDSLNESKRQLDSSAMQWSTFDENYEQLAKWVAEMESQVIGEPELKSTLQEKKAVLQHDKTRCQDILSHQTMVDSISDKGMALSSSQVQNKLKQLNSKYNSLCSAVKDRVKKAEEYVDQHQGYVDTHQQCRDWMASTQDRIAVCAEVSGDRQALQNRLERLEELVSNVKQGEQKVRAVHSLAQKTLPQTAPSGQANIRRDLDSLMSDWEGLVQRIDDTKQGLLQALKALETYDGTCEDLNRWLRDTENEVRSTELKPNLREKQAQVEKFKAMYEVVLGKREQFEELQAMAGQLQGTDTRLVHYTTQLGAKYEGLKSAIKDAIHKWNDYVEEHGAYQEQLVQCREWLEKLQRHLQLCSNLAGDRKDVEDRIGKLQELIVEKEEGASNIHHTAESGERLYPSTAAEGRDVIRQEIRSLREQWDELCDELAETQRRLEGNLMQWSSYDDNFQQFHKWLLDVEVKLKEDSELRATLPEKKAQLQNHRVVHQDILSRQHILENLADKARSLIQAAPSAKVNKFVGELQQKYAKICEQSKKVLDRFEGAVRDHQLYQDAAHDFTDWLNTSRDRLEACADRSGDKLSVQTKRERLKEFVDSIPEGEEKLNSAKALGKKTAANTSQAGRDVLQRETDHLQREWEDYLSWMRQTEQALEQALDQWGDFEVKFQDCTEWLRHMEQQVRSHDLKSTVKEKQAQVEKFKRQREEILSHQPEVDRFTDDAQNLMHTSSDIRLSTQVSQLTNKYQSLLMFVKDLIGKWEKMVHEHQAYESRLTEFNQWLAMANSKVADCQEHVGDQESMEGKRAIIQMLFSEKEHGLQRLNSSIEAGEKLNTDTANPGREKIRQELRSAKEDWDSLFTELSEAQRRLDAYLMQWSSYSDSQEQLLRWMTETEAALRADVDLKNTLQEKRLQLQNHRSLLQDIQSHQRLVDAVVEKAQGVLQTTSNSEVASFITEVSSRYEKLTTAAKAMIGKSEQHVTMHQQYQDSLQAAVDWMSQAKDKQTMCADTSGDRHTIHTKLERLQELLENLPEGLVKLKECESSVGAAMDTTAMKGRQAMKQELDVLKLDWEDYTVKLNSLKENLEQALHYWTIYEEKYEKMSSWIKSMEKQVKEFPLRTSLEEKQEQLKKYQDVVEEISHHRDYVEETSQFSVELVQDIRGHQREVDKFTDDAQTLQQLTGESRVGHFVTQLSNRYQTLLTAGKDIIKKCEQNVDDHRVYKEKAREFALWLDKAKAKFADCSDVGGSRTELEERLEKVQDLLRERDTGFARLNSVIESGERLYPSTAPEGREGIRQELRRLKMGLDTLFDELSAMQRKLEVALVQWTSFDDSYSQVEHWLREMELQLEGQVPLRSTLEEKKAQLQNFRALHHDAVSYNRVIESINDKAQNLAQTSSDSQLKNFISQTGARYEKLCIAARERVQQYEGFVTDHQTYNDAYNGCVDWLNSIREKLSACSDVSGDRHAIQSRLDKIQDILATKMEGEPKVKNVMALAQKVLPNTAPQGKDIITRDSEALRQDWEAFISALAKTKSDLESCMDQWEQFEKWVEKCSAWLKDTETRLREIDLKGTQHEKQTQLDRLRALQEDTVAHQGDLDALSDSAQDLMRLSTDTRVVSQASQLATKYQTANVNIKELCRRWEQYVLDHQAYAHSFDQCKGWLTSMRERVSSVVDTSGDRNTIQERLTRVRELLSEKDEGLHMLQIALDNLQIVLPNTSVTGRDNLRRAMQTLQQEYDTLSADLNEAKTKLEGCLAQWTVYDDSIEQLQRWLSDLEVQVATESHLQNTLQEKKLLLERVKVLQLNISSQQSTIDNLNDKAANLKQTSKDVNLSHQIKQVVSRYEQLGTTAKELLQTAERNLKDHQVYRDSYLDTSDWLSAIVDKLNVCSDLRGDRSTIEAQLHKVQTISASVDVGKKKLETTLTKGQVVIPQTSSKGQELVREELTMLSNDFQTFQADLSDLIASLSKLREQWQQYEEFYDENSQWMKDMEVSMKADAELKPNLEQKMTQLDKQKACHEEILEQQSALDSLAEQAQVLLQSSTDSRVSTQLSQLGTRYTALITLSKDLLKRYEQHVQDHQQFHSMYNEAASWLEETRDKLAVCTDTTGDRFAIQSQIEKLQEFAVMKEEGQLMIHTTTTWGEKTMTNTSVEGKEIIRQELDTLQQDWDSLITEVSDTKTALEACLVQWTDFSASHDQVLKWLKEVERKLRDTQPKPDLAEKKAELQRIKGIYQDIVSYEQMVESVTGKAQDLAQKSPASKSTTDTSSIATRYSTLKEQAKELLARNEQQVAHHQGFHDACGSFSSWLRTSVEKLATCSDTYGEYTAIEAKIERAKSLFADLTEGSQRLAQATKAGEATLASTSASGQTRIRQDIKAMNKDFEEFRSQLVAAQSELEICLSRWEEFEGSYAEFNNWLKDTESELRADLELKATVEEKKHHWEHFQLRLEEILSKQDALDRVSEKATALLQTNADAKTSHAITQLTTRYHGIIALAKDIVNSLEQYYNHHLGYKQSQHAFLDWLKEAKHHIKAIHDDHSSRDDVSTKLSKLDEVQATMDEGHGLLRALMDSSEKTLPNTSPRGCQAIRTDTDTAKKEYENLLTNLSQTKRSLENAASHWADFSRLNVQLSDWLSSVEAKLRGEPELKADLPEKRSNLEKYRALQADIAAHRELFDRLEEKAGNLKDPEPHSSVSDLHNRYQSAIGKCKDALSLVEGRVASHEEYRKAYISCLDWLANTKHRLQRLSDCTGDRRMLQDRLDQLREFKADLHQGQDMVTKAGSLGDRLCQTTAPRGQDIIRREVSSLREDWAAFSTAVADVESNLETCIANWMELDGEHMSFVQWLERMEGRLKGLAEPRADLSHKQVQLQDGETLYDDIVQHKAELDRVRDKGESVSQRSSDPRVSSSMMQLSSKYQGLASSAKSMVRKLRENLQEHRNYDEALSAASKWLTKVSDRVRACSDTATDWHAIQEHIQDMKDITANMDDGLQKVNHVCDLAEKILPNTSGEGKRLVEQQVTELTNEWERLNDAIGECASMLEGLQQRWHEYEEYYGSLVRWLADVENTLRADPEPRAQLVEKKTQLDKYKMILADIENHQRLVNELADRVANLEALCDNPEVADSLADVKSRYNQARKKAKETVESLHRAYEEHHSFHEAAQECEKWLLQTSHRLLAHNSLNVRSMELTQRQIEKHQALIEEIQDFRLTLDQLRQRGQELIVANARMPRLSQQIQSQLQNLEESYNNLESTAHQIRERLREMLDKWEAYRQLLERTEGYLQSDLPAWLSKADAEVPDTLDDAQRQRENTQAMLEHLYGMKQEVTAAAHRCENLGSTESLDQLEATIESPLSKMAERVHTQMQEGITKVERRLDRLRDIIRQWDGVERTRAELRQWLHGKQEEVSELEQRSARLHPEAAQLDIQRIQAIRDEVERRGPAVEEFMSQYRALTQHKPSLADPVVRALQDDWEELLGQVTNLLEERQTSLVQARELQDRNQSLDEDLDNYARELERIDRAEVTMAEKGVQMKPSRRACRSTQTPRSPRRPQDPYDSDSDGGDVFWPGGGGFGPGPGPGGARGGGGPPRSPRGKGLFPPSPRHPPNLRRSYLSLNRSRRFDDHDPKKGAAAGLESESEESGYGETYGETMHASSFDTHLDEPSEWMGTVTMRGTLMTYEDSDNESAASYITGIFHPVDPEDLRDASCQTPGHARTQTEGARSRDFGTQSARSIQTQTAEQPRSAAMQTSTASLHSIGAQTKRSSGSRSNLLRSILLEVKDIKRQQGVDSDSFRDDASEVSDAASVSRGALQALYDDVHALRAAGARSTAATQTQSEQATQTSLRLFPEGDPVRSARHGRLQDILDEVRHMRGGGGERSASPLHTPTSHQATMDSPFDPRGPSSSLARSSPSRMERMDSPRPLSSAPAMAAASGPVPVNGHLPYPPAYGASYVPQPAAYPYPYPPGYAPGPPPDRLSPLVGRRVTQDDLNNISERLERLRSLQLPMRRSMPVLPPAPPPPPPRTLPEPPRRYRVREFTRSFDDMDLVLQEERGRGVRRRGRSSHSVHDRYHLDGLEDALMASKELKRMSRKMKKTLRNELMKF